MFSALGKAVSMTKDMKNIAIFTSGEGRCAQRLASLFNQGTEIRVELIITDRGDTRLVEQMIPQGVNALFLPRVVWQNNPDEVLSLLSKNDISLLALDKFDDPLPEAIKERYAGKIVKLTSPEEAPMEVVAAFESEDSAPADMPEIPKSVDEEWAETLKINFDQSRATQTPPPIPDLDSPSPSQPLNVAPSHPYHPTSPQPLQEPMPSTYLIWSILCTIFCCFIPGIVAIIFSSQVSSKYYMGDLEGAKKASRNAEIWIIVSFVLGILTATLYLPIMLVSNS